MLFADDLVFVDELRVGVNAKLKRESEALESKGFKNKSYKDNIWIATSVGIH